MDIINNDITNIINNQIESEKSNNENATGEPDDDEEDEKPIEILIQNIVATVNLGCTVDLEKIAQTARNAEYNPKRFQAVIMRIRDPKTTALIFHSGKMIVTGAKTEEDSKLASKKYTIIIQKVGIPATYNRYTIQNMTATCDVDFPIRLEGLIMNHAANATYEPELFPGLIYRVPDSKTVILIFVSGKLVLTGAKSVGSLTTALENIFPILEEFKKKLNVRGIANSSK